MDEPSAAALFELLAPELPAWERSVRDAEPGLADADVHDRALRCALMLLRREVSEQTLAYLRWRAAQVRASAAATVAASVAARHARHARQTRAAAQAGAGVRPPFADRAPAAPAEKTGAAPRTFWATDGRLWSAHELTLADVSWAQAPRCLVFQSAAAVRRVWHYPADWRSLPDPALETLSWQV